MYACMYACMYVCMYACMYYILYVTCMHTYRAITSGTDVHLVGLTGNKRTGSVVTSKQVKVSGDTPFSGICNVTYTHTHTYIL